MGRWGRSGAVIALLALAGCAGSGMSEDECRVMDWRALGFEDGARGASPETFGVHRRACGEHGVAARFDDYLAGHAEGLERFCRPENGRRLGENGRSYAGVCPADLEGPFLAAHREGYGLYERERRVDELRIQLQHKRARTHDIERLVVDKTAALVSPLLTPTERAHLGIEIRNLGEERIGLEHQIARLEQDLAEARREYEEYRGGVANQSAD